MPTGGSPGIGFNVEQMKDVEPPGTTRTTLDRGATQHAEITLSVIPNRFGWRDANGRRMSVR